MATPVIVEHLEICEPEGLSAQLNEECVYRFVRFTGLSMEGGHIDAAFLTCTFTRIDWYWGIFNCAVFVECQFEDCIFLGAAFPDCKFVECSFVRCRFAKDNMGGDCSFDGAKWYGCTQTDCEGLSEHVPVTPQ
ncbi:MAG: pentapeptide repeat-containing protein [Candidatus Hydrogenedentes bacterium]|nr:pentapeptide repeat-containing protein [Candidatus Hydrogenedentota bacterium]